MGFHLKELKLFFRIPYERQNTFIVQQAQIANKI